MRFLLIVLFPLIAFAEKAPLDLIVIGKETKQNYSESGIIYLKETRLKGKSDLTGRIIASKVEADSALFIGSSDITQTTFHQAVTLWGTVEAKKTTFEQKLTLTTDSAVFKECHIHSISLYAYPGSKGPTKLEITKGTIVEGSIRFEDSDGEVIISADSVVKGNILASKITRK